MRFAICQLMFGDMPYFQHSSAINRVYAERHSYTYRVGGISEESERRWDILGKMYWKIPLVKELLQSHDAVLYLDADAYIVMQQHPLDVFYSMFFQEERIACAFGENAVDSKRRWSRNEINAGVFIFRKHPKSQEILDQWWLRGTPDKIPVSGPDMPRWNQFLDQEVFNKKILPEFGEHVNIVLTPNFGGRDGIYVRHWLLVPAEERKIRIEQDRKLILGS